MLLPLLWSAMAVIDTAAEIEPLILALLLLLDWLVLVLAATKA